MILGFMKQFPWGEPTYFKEKILDEPIQQGQSVNKLVTRFYVYPAKKIHTIRAGEKRRLKAGDLLHMATGARSKHYNQFNKDLPHLQRVKSVQRIDIIHRGPNCCIVFIDRKIFYSKIDYLRSTFHKSEMKVHEKKEHNREAFIEFLQNDGLTEEQFWKFFKKQNLRNGQIIHWTDKRY